MQEQRGQELLSRPEYACDDSFLCAIESLRTIPEEVHAIPQIPVIRNLPALLLLRRVDAGSRKTVTLVFALVGAGNAIVPAEIVFVDKAPEKSNPQR